MDINEVQRAMVMRDAESQKESLNGIAKVELHYHQGKITKAFYDVRSSLIPGADPKSMNPDSRNAHGG